MGEALNVQHVTEIHGGKLGHQVLHEIISCLLLANDSVGCENQTFGVSAAQSVVKGILAFLFSESDDLNTSLNCTHLGYKLLS